jgi:hypothetical protein
MLQPSSFAKQARFTNPNKLQTPEPGRYHRQVDWTVARRTPVSEHRKDLLKVCSIPSIPTKKQTYYPY